MEFESSPLGQLLVALNREAGEPVSALYLTLEDLAEGLVAAAVDPVQQEHREGVRLAERGLAQNAAAAQYELYARALDGPLEAAADRAYRLALLAGLRAETLDAPHLSGEFDLELASVIRSELQGAARRAFEIVIERRRAEFAEALPAAYAYGRQLRQQALEFLNA